MQAMHHFPVTGKVREPQFLSVFATVLFFLLLIFLKTRSILVLAGGILAFSLMFWAVFSVKNTLILLFAYLSFLPNYGWGRHYPFFKGIYFSQPLVYAFAGILLFWMIADRLNGTGVRDQADSMWQDRSVIMLLAVSLLAAFNGAASGADPGMVRGEAFFLMCYAFYFIYTRTLDPDQAFSILRIFAVIVTFVSIEYLLLAFSEGAVSGLFVNRVVTQQPNLSQLAFPFFCSFLFFESSFYQKLFSVLAMLLITFMLLICQQRGLWVGVFASTVSLVTFTFFKDRITSGKVVKYFASLVLIAGLLLTGFLILDRIISGSVFITFMYKLYTLSDLSGDLSTNIRLSEISRALDLWDNNLFTVLFGTGLGDRFESVDAMRTGTEVVDCTYVYILWKTGLAGLVCFLAVMFNFYKKGIAAFLRVTAQREKQVLAVLMSGMTGLMIIALTNTVLVRYRFIIIWSFMLAYVEILHFSSLKASDSPQPEGYLS